MGRIISALGRRQINGEYRALGAVGLHPDPAVVIRDDAVDDGQPQARAPALGGEVGQEELFLVRVGDSLARVGDRQPQAAVLPGGPHHHLAGGVGGLHRVVQEIDQCLFELLGVDPDMAGVGVHFPLHLDAGLEALVKIQGLVDELGEVGFLGLGVGHPGVAGEFIHHALEGGDFPDDDVDPILQSFADIRVVGLVALQEPLGGEADGGQGILDLMGDAPGGLGPGG